jgi:hypothetical protein
MRYLTVTTTLKIHQLLLWTARALWILSTIPTIKCSQVRYWWALSGRSWLSEFRPLSQLSHKMGGKFRLNNWPNIMWSLWCSITLMLAPCEYCSGNQTSHNKCYAYLTTIAWCYTICVRPSWHTILLWPLLASAPHSHNATTILYMTAYHSLLRSCSLASSY